MDSTSAQSLATEILITGSNKHIDLKYHNVRELITAKVIQLHHVDSTMQPADFWLIFCLFLFFFTSSLA